jgi:hypothetical protein
MTLSVVCWTWDIVLEWMQQQQHLEPNPSTSRGSGLQRSWVDGQGTGETERLCVHAATNHWNWTAITEQQYLIKAAIRHLLLRLRLVAGARAPAAVLRLSYLQQLLLLLRLPGLLLLLGLQRLGDLGDGDEAVRLAEHQRVPGLEQLHARHARGAVPLLLLLLPLLLGPLPLVAGARAVRHERHVVARVGAHDLGGAGGPVQALDAAARVLHHRRRRLRRLAVAHPRSIGDPCSSAAPWRGPWVCSAGEGTQARTSLVLAAAASERFYDL